MSGMESGPAVFAGVVFTAFGAALLLWTSRRAWRRQPVAEGVCAKTAVTVAGLAGVLSLTCGVRLLLGG